MDRKLSTLAFLVLLWPVHALADDVSFSAWLDAESAYVHATPDLKSPTVGLLRSGDVVQVTSCVPSCDARQGWAVLGDRGAIRLSLLKRSEEDPTHQALSAVARYTYGTVRKEGTPLLASPDARKPLRRLKAGRVLAFRSQQTLLDAGWLETADGGVVRADAIRLAKPSLFQGESNPAPMTAFVLRRTGLWPPAGQFGPPRMAERYSRWAVSAVNGDKVITETGFLRRKDVRLAVVRTRPPAIPSDARWIHIDLNEQVLVAYEGEQPVYATLVSTGKSGHETPHGLFRVWLKTVHHRMTGTEPVPYEVDEVPFSLFFQRGTAVHGAFWHDAFGFVASHGCVNTSLADAEWLFQWAPPTLPEGWHAVTPGPTGMVSLYVLVENVPPRREWSPPVAAR